MGCRHFSGTSALRFPRLMAVVVIVVARRFDGSSDTLIDEPHGDEDDDGRRTCQINCARRREYLDRERFEMLVAGDEHFDTSGTATNPSNDMTPRRKAFLH